MALRPTPPRAETREQEFGVQDHVGYEYELVVVDDDELPEGTDWVVARAGRKVYLLVTKTRRDASPGFGEMWLLWAKAGGLEDARLSLAG